MWVALFIFKLVRTSHIRTSYLHTSSLFHLVISSPFASLTFNPLLWLGVTSHWACFTQPSLLRSEYIWCCALLHLRSNVSGIAITAHVLTETLHATKPTFTQTQESQSRPKNASIGKFVQVDNAKRKHLLEAYCWWSIFRRFRKTRLLSKCVRNADNSKPFKCAFSSGRTPRKARNLWKPTACAGARFANCRVILMICAIMFFAHVFKTIIERDIAN